SKVKHCTYISLITCTEIPPPIVAIYVHPERFTRDCLLYSKEFVLNLPNVNLAKEVSYCGTTSGRNVDKFKETGLTPAKSEKVSVPRIEECITHIECKLVNYFRASQSSSTMW
ncbi:MAG: flavin reductase family protein, partial [Candidatus Bathyarchaeia archaeon]